MTAVGQDRGIICPLCILGLDDQACRADVEAAYRRLKRILSAESLMDTPQGWVQGQQALLSVEDAYRRIESGEHAKEADGCHAMPPREALHPRLGQLLVAAGKITLNQLEDAIEKQKTLDLPLGEILKASSLITQMELDRFLLNQRQIKLPLGSPYITGKRLLGLGLLTEDMVYIALIEQRTSGKPLGDVLVEHGWLSPAIRDLLLEERNAVIV